jgi:hypothetical protein
MSVDLQFLMFKWLMLTTDKIKELNSVTGLVGASRRLALTRHPQAVALRRTPIILFNFINRHYQKTKL